MTTREKFKERVKKWSEKIQVEYKETYHYANILPIPKFLISY